jgi:hypothetical protein
LRDNKKNIIMGLEITYFLNYKLTLEYMGMENFEQFRKNTADQITGLPKSVQREALKAIKKENPEKYRQTKELHDAKRGLDELSKTETLVDQENPDEVVTWIKQELDAYSKRDYITTSHLEEMSEQIVKYLAKRLGITTGDLRISDFVSHEEKTTYGNSSEDSRTVITENSLVLV